MSSTCSRTLSLSPAPLGATETDAPKQLSIQLRPYTYDPKKSIVSEDQAERTADLGASKCFVNASRPRTTTAIVGKVQGKFFFVVSLKSLNLRSYSSAKGDSESGGESDGDNNDSNWGGKFYTQRQS